MLENSSNECYTYANLCVLLWRVIRLFDYFVMKVKCTFGRRPEIERHLTKTNTLSELEAAGLLCIEFATCLWTYE